MTRTAIVSCRMIRKATYSDIPRLMEIFECARGIMRSSGNMNQWNQGYPSEDIVRQDIDNGNCYVMEMEEKIMSTMAFIPGPDPTYSKIYEGEWPEDKPYHVIHRIAVGEPGHNAAVRMLDWAFSQTEAIRIDTHKDNVIMHHILGKYGFTHCGVIFLADGNPREAYYMSRRHPEIQTTII